MGALLPRRSTSASRSSSLLHALCDASRGIAQRQQIVNPPNTYPRIRAATCQPRYRGGRPLHPQRSAQPQTAATAALRAAQRGTRLPACMCCPATARRGNWEAAALRLYLIPGTAYATQSTTAHCMWTLPRRTRATYALCRRKLGGRTRPAYRCIRSATRH